MSQGKLLYEGKAKKIFEIPGSADLVYIEFKDSLTAFNAQKKGSFPQKGEVNRKIASFLFAHLKQKGVSSHWVHDEGPIGMVAKKLKIVPLEVVVRNILAGSTAKKLGYQEGVPLPQPLVEFYFKDDDLGDPFVSDDQITILKIADGKDIAILKQTALRINEVLRELFAMTNLELVDFKIEFGKNDQGQLFLADEITPDCCRLWDKTTGEKMDKDRFRRDLGSVKESYEDVLQRLLSLEKGKHL